MTARVAVDIGGTFTDIVYTDEAGELGARKVSTTPEDITVGILEGLVRADIDVSALDAFVHGTTIALNALLEGKTPRVGLITTKGFRDVLEIMRTNRPDMYDLQQEKPVPLVPRRDRVEISARMTYTGETLAPVDSDEVRAVAKRFAADGVGSIAVSLLHAYVNPEHEREIGRLLREELPQATISLSTDISRMWREFERTSTAVSNAATKPIVARYLRSLERKLSAERFGGRVLIMQSNGGVMSASEARERPVATLMSGPVGGVTGALEISRLLGGDRDLVTLDIGGTSADVAIVDRGEAVTRTVGHIGRWPVMVPMVDIVSIGAGGGSIARVDEFGALLVGPESAGADPGPACYGRGGTAATVTDANLLLGRIDPAYFLGGELELDIGAAEQALRTHVADPYAMEVQQAAEGVITVINSNMTRLLWEVMIGRGYDPRDFALLAFGGGGPLHACELAQALGIEKVIVPVEPGTFSAIGILGADLRHDRERMMTGGEAGSSAAVAAAFTELEREGLAQLEAEQAGHLEVEFIRSAELRYIGQDHWISVELPRADDGDSLAAARTLFHDKHERLYGFRREETPVDLVRIQVSTVGRLPVGAVGAAETNGAGAPTRKARRVYAGGGWVDAAFVDRAALPVDEELDGPYVIEEAGSTTYVPPGCRVRRDPHGLLHIDVPTEGSEL
ncbi:MAG: hydantoinase/oxoprolinase family protein [Vicinamibacterales bacterium]